MNIINFVDTFLADIIVVVGEKQPIQYPVQTIVPMSMSSKDLIEVANVHRFV